MMYEPSWVASMRLNEPSDDGCQGYIFHASCYSLLQEPFDPREVSIAHLWEMCRSCPTYSGYLDWGHDYGVLFDTDKDLPWIEPQLAFEIPEATHLYLSDPFKVLELEVIVLKWQLGKIRKYQVKSSTASSTHNPPVPNSFTKLPLEILQRIMCHFYVENVQNLSQTSRALAILNPHR